MKYCSFERPSGLNLEEEISTGFLFYSVKSDKFARPFAVYLSRSNGSFISFKSFLYNIAPRVEVGSLRIEGGSERLSYQEIKRLPEEFQRGLHFQGLNMLIGCCEVESGIAIIGNSGNELIICPGEMPFSIHVESSFFKDKFKSEFNLSDYVRTNPQN